jgi:hypothetical protein
MLRQSSFSLVPSQANLAGAHGAAQYGRPHESRPCGQDNRAREVRPQLNLDKYAEQVVDLEGLEPSAQLLQNLLTVGTSLTLRHAWQR